MKFTFSIIAIMLFATNIFSQPVTSNNKCTDLFFTELTFGKNPKGGGLFDLNYALEIFNSSNSAVNLSNYSLDLTTASGTVSSIALSGTLASHDVFVLGNSNADLNLQGLCDQLSSNLDFGINASIELKKGTITIDKLGIGGNSVPTSFDVVQFSADPYNYLLNFHLDLSDYNNIDIRRSMLAQSGNPNFNASTDVLGQWWYTLNTDRSDIGSYIGVCNKPLGMDIVGYLQPYSIIDYPSFNNDFLDLNINGSPNGILSISGIKFNHAEQPSSTGDVCNDGTIVNPPFTFDPVTNSVNPLSSYCKGVEINYPNNGTSSGSKLIATGWAGLGKDCDFFLTSLTLGITMDPASQNHRSHIDHSVGINQIYKNTLLANVYPNVTSSFINVKCNEITKSSLFSSVGNLVFEQTNKGDFNIDLTNLASGVYYLNLKTKDGLIFNSQITKN
jgi:hypothetical protein